MEVSKIRKRHFKNMTDLKDLRRLLYAEQLIAMKFKVRMYQKYAREQGGNVYFREKNRMRRQVTLVAAVAYSVKEHKSQKAIAFFLEFVRGREKIRDKMAAFYEKMLRLQGTWRKLLRESAERLQTLVHQTQEEYENIQLFYEIQSKDKDKQSRKSAQNMLRLLREAQPLLWEPCDQEHAHEGPEDPAQVSVESAELDLEVGPDAKEKGTGHECLEVVGERMRPSRSLQNCLEQYQKKMRTDYMMSYITYQYCQVKMKLLKLLKDELDYDSDGEKFTTYKHALAIRKYTKLETNIIESIKKYRTCVHFTNERLFADTYQIEADRSFEKTNNQLKQELAALKLVKKKSKAAKDKLCASGKYGNQKAAQKSDAEKLAQTIQEQNDAKQREIDKVIGQIFSKGGIPLKQMERVQKPDNFLFVPRKIHLHQILVKQSGYKTEY